MDMQTIKNFWMKYLNMLSNQLDIDLYLFYQLLITFSSLETGVFYHCAKQEIKSFSLYI